MVEGEEMLNFDDISNVANSFYENLYKKDWGEKSYIDNLFRVGL